jgi:hypothetical protein
VKKKIFKILFVINYKFIKLKEQLKIKTHSGTGSSCYFHSLHKVVIISFKSEVSERKIANKKKSKNVKKSANDSFVGKHGYW